MSRVKIISNKEILIGERILPIFHHDPLIDGAEYSLETTSDSKNKFQPELYVRQLKGVTANLLPDRLDISIYNPKSPFRFIDYLVVKKRATSCTMTIFLTFYYSKWDHALNLVQWSEIFRSDLLSKVTAIKTAVKHRDEYGVNFLCDVNLSDTDDIFEVFERVGSDIETVYVQSIKRADIAISDSQSELLPDKRRELRWWIQYVVVPLLGSGAFAALVAWLVMN